MRKNKAAVNALRKEWKLEKDFEALKWYEQFAVVWWIVWGNPRGLFFLFQQVKMRQTARKSYDTAKQPKPLIVITLANAGYYKYDKCC